MKGQFAIDKLLIWVYNNNRGIKMKKRGRLWANRDGDITQKVLMDIFIVFIGYKIFGWLGIVIPIGTYIIGAIVNWLKYPSLE